MRSRWTWSAAGFVALLAACAQETVAHQQLEREANRILVVLEQKGIAAEKVRDSESRSLRFNVTVPRGQFASALSVLEKENLPKTMQASSRDMVEGGGMIPTTQQERMKQMVGLEGDIINALREIPGVIEVQAAVSVPEPDPLRDVTEARPKPKASVLVVYAGASAPPITAEDVQKFVQAKLPDITSKEVNVLLLPSEAERSQPSEASAGGGGPAIIGGLDPAVACEKETVLGLQVCTGNKQRLYYMVLSATVVAMVLAGLLIVMVLRAMQYRRDLTRLTAQFERVKT